MEAEKLRWAMELIENCRRELGKRVIGQREMIDGLLTALLAGGHALLEGVPGLAKTLAVKTLAELTELDFKRIQFTPDLLPADLTGSLIWEPATATFAVRRGPVFANIVLADEINRAPAKVQSALLEAMEERQVTIGDHRLRLPEPFFVLATQNPIEHEGTYALPEAELDRFLVKLMVDYPTAAEEEQVVRLSVLPLENLPVLDPVLRPRDIAAVAEVVDGIVFDDRLLKYLVALTAASRPPRKKAGAPPLYRHICFGASPRASIALFRCARIRALFEGRGYVIPEDIKAAAPAVFRHRIVLSFEAESDGLHADDIVRTLLAAVPLP